MKRFCSAKKWVLPGVTLCSALLVTPAVVAQTGSQFVPMLNARIGPYAPVFTAITAGYTDYMAMLNKRDGGINGVKLVWEECEFEYKTELGVACYEKLKKKGVTGASVFAPFSTGVTYALIEKATADKIPLVTMGYGRADASDGRSFPYVFPITTNYWSQATTIMKFISLRSGGWDKVRGKKIAYLYHDSPYGKEGIAIFDLMAKKYGFEVMYVPVKPPGDNQASEWQLIKQALPDWVVLWGFGAMNPVALVTAHKHGYPAARIVGVWWAGAEEDVVPAGEAAKGFTAAAINLTGDSFPVIGDIRKYLYDRANAGASADAARIGTTLYNRGVLQGIVTTEAIRKAHERFGKRALTGEELRWGLENLSIGDLRINKLGAFGLMQPLKLSCLDHEGGGAVRFQRWNGATWIPMTGWIDSDKALVRPMIEQAAAKYANERGIIPRDCAKERQT